MASEEPELSNASQAEPAWDVILVNPKSTQQKPNGRNVIGATHLARVSAEFVNRTFPNAIASMERVSAADAPDLMWRKTLSVFTDLM